MTSHTEANYNKFTSKGKGTLVGNWAEERALREFSGVGRTIVKEHIPKRHLDFENPIQTDKVFDNTSNRIYGEKQFHPMLTETYHIGKSVNQADSLPKIGERTKRLEADIAQKVHEEFMENERRYAAQKEIRYFETTNKSVHVPLDHKANVIGRKVMVTQDGAQVDLNNKDFQLVVEHGTWRRLQKNNDGELQQRVPQGDYTKQVPVTFWTHQLQRKNFYMSPAVGPNPFAKTSGMTQSADQTKAVIGHYGNIDFESEAKRTQLNSTNI